MSAVALNLLGWCSSNSVLVCGRCPTLILASLTECLHYFPHLPMNEMAQFKVTLRRHLNIHSLYFVNELLVLKNVS